MSSQIIVIKRFMRDLDPADSSSFLKYHPSGELFPTAVAVIPMVESGPDLLESFILMLFPLSNRIIPLARQRMDAEISASGCPERLKVL